MNEIPLVLWRGYHSSSSNPPNLQNTDSELRNLFSQAMNKKNLLILCPPTLEQFDFLEQLPPGNLQLVGEWKGVSLPKRVGHNNTYPEQPSIGVFTSGSTASSRLVLYTRTNIESCSQAIFRLFDRSKIKRVFCYPQPFHTFGLTLGYATAELFGWELVVPDGRYNHRHHQSWLQSVDANLLTLGTPTHFIDLVSYLKNNQITPSNSYSAIIGGARVSRDLWLDLRNVAKILSPSIGYGATEASPGVSHLPPGQEPSVDGEVGSFLPQLKVTVDADKGVTFSGPSLCSAIIFKGQVEFPKSFTLTDSLQMQNDGRNIYQGRLLHVLNRGSEKLFLEEVDNKIRQHFSIECLSFSADHPRLGEELGLLIKASEQMFLEIKNSIYSLLRKDFHMNFDDNYSTFVSEIPLNANLKPDRLAAKLYFKAKSCVSDLKHP